MRQKLYALGSRQRFLERFELRHSKHLTTARSERGYQLFARNKTTKCGLGNLQVFHGLRRSKGLAHQRSEHLSVTHIVVLKSVCRQNSKELLALLRRHLP